ncbi:MAG TPA: 3'-5' exonuclease, partial [Pirellulaceae bacterium]
EDKGNDQKEVTARFVADQVCDWTRRAPGRTIGVLVRVNAAVRRIIFELRELGIEASEEGGCTLDDSAAVQLVMSLCTLADHPGDRVARYHIATSPLANWLELFSEPDQTDADGDVGGGVVEAPGPTDSDASTVNESAPQRAIRFVSSQGNAAAGRLARRVREQLITHGYGATLDRLARQLAPSCNEREARRLEKLVGLAYQYDAAATSRPNDFVTFVGTAKVRDPIAAAVRVMTIHQAKGLEFDIVVLSDLDADLIGQRSSLVVGRPAPTEPIDRVCRYCNQTLRNLLPATWQRMFRESEDQDVAESLCVLYVAMTRAVHALHMIVAPSSKSEKVL